MSVLLTTDDLVSLTGYIRPDKQRSELRRLNIPFIETRKGRPVVTAASIMRLIDGDDVVPSVPDLPESDAASTVEQQSHPKSEKK